MVILYGTAGVVLIQTLTCFFYKLFECTPVRDSWKPPGSPGLDCVSTDANEAMMTGHAVVGIMADLVLMALPIWVIYTKMMFSRKKFQVILVFSVGVFVVVTGIVRLYYMKTLDFAVDSSYKMATIGVWTDLEGHVGLWCGCFPALQPILRIASYKLGLRSSPLSYGDRPTGQSGQPSSGHVLGSRPRTRSRHQYLRSGNGVDFDGLDSDTDSQKGMVKQHENPGKSMELGEIQKEREANIALGTPRA
ncbi:hypothetical protein E8E14_005241 [Neopestalotiopsis sp. 37M]|nr:hypothetical protein E8E14_005241 [Neopestalotiopsis sp. 37M]